MTDHGRAPSGQALVSDGAQLHGLHPTGFDPSRKFYEARPDVFFTGTLGEDGEEITRPVAWDDLTDQRRSEITAEADMESKSIDQITGLISAMPPLIELYSRNVSQAEERFQREREFLADLMAEFLRLSHFVARKGAIALEASALEPRDAA